MNNVNSSEPNAIIDDKTNETIWGCCKDNAVALSIMIVGFLLSIPGGVAALAYPMNRDTALALVGGIGLYVIGLAMVFFSPKNKRQDDVPWLAVTLMSVRAVYLILMVFATAGPIAAVCLILCSVK